MASRPSVYGRLRSWWRRWYWRKLYRLQTPLALRRSFRLLRGHSPTLSGAVYSFLRLLWPVPRTFPCRLPETPRFLVQNPGLVYDRNVCVYELKLLPLWRWRDTPQRSFYRMYDTLCGDQEDLLGYETEYFFKRRDPAWSLHLLPDPRDDADPERYAVLASLAEDLVDAFNWRLALGLRRGAPMVDHADDGTPAPFVPERYPEWTKKAPSLKEQLFLHEPVLGADKPEDSFVRRNIVAGTGSLRTI